VRASFEVRVRPIESPRGETSLRFSLQSLLGAAVFVSTLLAPAIPASAGTQASEADPSAPAAAEARPEDASSHGATAESAPATGGPSENAAGGHGGPAGSEIEFVPFKDEAFLEAKKSGAPVVLYFEADWCAPCKEMHARTFRTPAVLEAAAGVRFFRIDMTMPDRYVELVQKSFRIVGAPTVVLFGPDGKESGRRFGFIPPDDFVKMLGASRKPSPGT
jgi:thiol-disulfide isomerase/thioredoxin